jgi:hypothetical protein
MKSWTRLEPGVYTADDGELRIIAYELLDAHGYEPTTVNVVLLAQTFKRIIEERNPSIRVIITHDPPPTVTGASHVS